METRLHDPVASTIRAHRAPDPTPEEEPIPEPKPIPVEDPVPDHNPSRSLAGTANLSLAGTARLTI